MRIELTLVYSRLRAYNDPKLFSKVVEVIEEALRTSNLQPTSIIVKAKSDE